MNSYPKYCLSLVFLSVALWIKHSSLKAEEDSSSNSVDSKSSTEAGHSFHGEVFDKGPRQAAYLMPGMGNIHWKIETKSPMAQRFFDQGIGQLHGFWYFEAERSFRQVAAIDPDCPMAYWGMTRANMQNEKRARGFIAESMKRIEKASVMESRLIKALSKLLEVDPKLTKKSRLEIYIKTLEELATEYPEHIEVQAMLVLHLWESEKEGLKIQSRVAVDAMLEKIFSVNPRHPAHHFRIHLWDNSNRKRALASAAACGPAAPGIAHMWHMPGHTYSGLKRYNDAAWQQEASSRVDHAHMMRDRVMPDQIHNFAHNNEWLIRTWTKTGQVERAMSLAKNMSELPRHPDYNTLTKGSSNFGRKRILSVATTYGLWDQLLSLSETPYWEATKDEKLDDERSAWIAIAYAMVGNAKESQKVRQLIETQRQTIFTEQNKLLDELHRIQAKRTTNKSKTSKPVVSKPPRAPKLTAEIELDEFAWNELSNDQKATEPKLFTEEATKEWSEEEKNQAKKWRDGQDRLRSLDQQIKAVLAFQAASTSQYLEAITLARQAGSMIPNHFRLAWYSELGMHREALGKAKELIKAEPSDVIALGNGVWLAWQAKDRKQAKAWAVDFAKASSATDKNLALVQPLSPIFEELAIDFDAIRKSAIASDLGVRPELDTLGPDRWSPYAAPTWALTDNHARHVSSKSCQGKPYVLIFYLGLGCLHCVEQLQAISPMLEQFHAAGLDVFAVSSENSTSLREGLVNYGKSMDIPLFANPDLDVFKEFRCFDDFENQPLHGTFVVDAKGRVRWQDLGAEPFMDIEFLLRESKRLLAMY
jgi:peroxiredoxin